MVSPQVICPSGSHRLADRRIVTPCDPNVTQFTSPVKGPVRARSRGRSLLQCMRGWCQYPTMARSEDGAPHRPLARQVAKGEFPMQIRALAFISTIILITAAAHAGDEQSEIAKCAGIADSAARLKCFDAAAPGQGGFGFPAPQAVTREEDIDTPPPPPKITHTTATVIELARTLRGRSIFVLDNGQVWRQLDGDDADVQDPRPGKPMKVAIETGVPLLA